jgi:AcrR family transcriptional regulator
MTQEEEIGIESTREKILTLAGHYFFANGHRGVTMAELAKIAGVSRKTLYVYFPMKLLILKAVMNRLFTEVYAGLEEEKNAHPESSVTALAAVLVRWQGYLSRVQPVFWNDLRRDANEFLVSTAEKRQKIVHGIFGTIIEEGIARGEFRGDFQAHVLADIFIGAAEALIRSDRPRDMNLTPREILLMLVTLLIEGSLTDAGREKWLENRPNLSTRKTITEGK